VSVVEPPDPVPAGCLVDLGQARSKLMDAVVESDDGLMEKYLGEGTISHDELVNAIPKALASGTVIPIFCTAAKKDIAVRAAAKDIAAPSKASICKLLGHGENRT
jgi:elongation factor G